MSKKIETILLEYLMGEDAITNEEAIAIQEAEKRFYESLVIGSDMILTDGNRLINGRRNRLWGVLKKEDTKNFPMVSKSTFDGDQKKRKLLFVSYCSVDMEGEQESVISRPRIWYVIAVF
ncbi:hypothetical protein [Exiguobacterium artemiae]